MAPSPGPSHLLRLSEPRALGCPRAQTGFPYKANSLLVQCLGQMATNFFKITQNINILLPGKAKAIKKLKAPYMIFNYEVMSDF